MTTMTSKRVVVTRPIVGICFMQVCAEADATDEEILEVCNRENPSGTRNGWTTVVRHAGDCGMATKMSEPTVCGSDPKRLHFLASC
jgi:hypothetical protein